MNYWDVIEGNWKQAKDNIRTRWGRLSDQQIEDIAGKRSELVDTIRECYGIAHDDADKQVGEWEMQSQKMFARAAHRNRKRAEEARLTRPAPAGSPDSAR
jgi:uncharacterized protein YjbJ (UPF0337 family)